MTLDTPHGPFTKILKKWPKKFRKNEGGYYFSPFWCLIQKLKYNLGLHAKKSESKKSVIKNNGFFCH